MRPLIWLHVVVLQSLAVQFTASSSPREVIWSSRTYGPDGPWHAITVEFGTPGQSIDAYPAGTWESLLFSNEVCTEPKPGPTCYAEDAGVYTPSDSESSTVLDVTDNNDTFYGTQTLFGSGRYYLDNLVLPGTNIFPSIEVANLATFVVSAGSRVLPNGTMYSAAVGNIALGSPGVNMTFGSTNGALLTGTMYDNGDVPSSSFGLHIGSAALGLPGSLYIGGYDQLRVIGPVSGQAYTQATFPIDLLDISIGVATGASPFNFTSTSGLLSKGNASLSPSLLVEVDAKEPYLYLPQSTCQAIAAHLPVSYNADLGLYLWNTNDPTYELIVSSPTFLGFTFRANNSVTQNMTINVPFRLLNLNLTEPLAHIGTPYFPCSLPSLNTYRLGRSFLQAAFISVNWETNYDGYWFLAQAPGPNIAPAPKVVSIGVSANTLLPSSNTWIDSWSGYWRPISDDGTQSNPNSTDASSSSSGSTGMEASSLSTGAKAGIGIAAAIALLSIVAAVLLLRRRATRRGMSRAGTGKSVQVGLQNMTGHPSHDQFWNSAAVPYYSAPNSTHNNGMYIPSELDGSQLSELHGTPHVFEAPVEKVSVPFRSLAELEGSSDGLMPRRHKQ